MTKAFCTHCGTQYQSLDWPRECNGCGVITWKNPIPVVNVLQPVYDSLPHRLGLAIAQRAIEPARGGWAFVGGYVDMQDSCLITAARREFREETGLELRGKGTIVHSELNNRGNMLVTVRMDTAMSLGEFLQGIPCSENYALDVLWDPTDRDLCFPIHQKVAEMWFNGEFE